MMNCNKLDNLRKLNIDDCGLLAACHGSTLKIFIGDKQKELRLVKTIHEICDRYDWVEDIVFTYDNKYLIVGCHTGAIKLVDTQTLQIKNFRKIGLNEWWLMSIKLDAKALFVGYSDGFFRQFDIQKRKLIKNYGQIYEDAVKEILITADGKYLFLANTQCHLKQFDIKQQKSIKDYGQVANDKNWSMTVTNDSQYLFIGSLANLKQFDIKKQKLIKNYQFEAMCMAITTDSKYLFIFNGRNITRINVQKLNDFKNYLEVTE